MIAIDTNILVYSHREDSHFHKKALGQLKNLAESGLDWAIPWPCIHEFLAIVTHPRIYKPPTPLNAAIAQVDTWLASPTLRILSETDLHWSKMKKIVLEGKLQGTIIHDARIACLCLEAGVSKLWTADRDFSRIASLKIENPLI